MLKTLSYTPGPEVLVNFVQIWQKSDFIVVFYLTTENEEAKRELGVSDRIALVTV